MNLRKSRIPVLVATVALTCGVSLRAASASSPATPAHAAKGTIIIDFQNDVSHLDTGKCYDTECYPFMKIMYDRLVDYKGTGPTIVPDAAAAMPKISNGGKTYTFKLRHNVRFWNGHLATSADWKYSFERVLNPATQAGAASFWQDIVGARAFMGGKAKHVSGIKTLGKWGLRITLTAPDAAFLNVLAMPFGSVVDQSVIKKYGKSYDALHSMGTGPYMLKQHVVGQRLILVKNPHYFGGNVGHVARIEVDFGVDANTGLLRIERDQADLDGDGIPSADFLSVAHDPKWSKLLYHYLENGLYYVSLNTLDKPFTKVEVRRAINMAINKPLITRLINGRGVPASTVLPPGMPGYGKFDLYPYNPAKAKQLLAKAGYPRGFTTTFYSDNIADDPRLSQAIVQQLAQIGVKVNLKIVNGNTWQTIVGTKYKAPMSWSAWFQDFPDPNDFFEPILSCASASPGTFNEPWYCNPRVDKFANKLKAMTNRAQRLQQYSKLDRMVMQDAPIVPIYYPYFYDLRSVSLHNYSYSGQWGWLLENMTKS